MEAEASPEGLQPEQKEQMEQKKEEKKEQKKEEEKKEEDGPLEDWRRKELVAECKALGLSDYGVRADLVARIKEARAAAESDNERPRRPRRQSACTNKSVGLFKNEFPNEVLEALDLPKEQEMPAGYNASDDSDDDYKPKGKTSRSKTRSSEEDSDSKED